MPTVERPFQAAMTAFLRAFFSRNAGKNAGMAGLKACSTPVYKPGG
jgi:hypothetical protein